MVKGQPNDDIAVHIGWPIAQQTWLRRPGGAQLGLPARGGRDAVGFHLPAHPGNTQAYIFQMRRRANSGSRAIATSLRWNLDASIGARRIISLSSPSGTASGL